MCSESASHLRYPCVPVTPTLRVKDSSTSAELSAFALQRRHVTGDLRAKGVHAEPDAFLASVCPPLVHNESV
jgi:hypothetical protein